MSELNDDLLNDDLGDDLDDQALLGADEDDLLLSDDDLEKDVSFATKEHLKNEAEKWVNSKLQTSKTESCENETKKVEDLVSTSSCKEVDINDQKQSELNTATESDVSTSEESPSKIPCKNFDTETRFQVPQCKNDEVSSTNKEIEEQSVLQQTTQIHKYSSPNEPLERQASEIIQSSQESSSAPEEISSDPREDFEERAERTNIKQIVERHDDFDSSPEKYQHARFFPGKRGRGGMSIRGGHFPGMRPPVRYPHLSYQQYPHPNENINPQLPSQFPYNPMDPHMVPRPQYQQNSLGPRMEFRPAMGPNFRHQNPNEFGMYRGPRPDYSNHVNGAPFGNYASQNHMRPIYRADSNMQMQPQRFDMRPRLSMPRPQGVPIPPPYIPTPINPQHQATSAQQHPGNMSVIVNTSTASQSGQQPVVPRKVLINPNFKGGVEAAKSQLLKDTQFIQSISSHISHLQSDEELLRQQEEFINKNRMHIEKRRYERSPERNRSRERSYSPPRREWRGDSRERRAGSRGRLRRAGSKEFDIKCMPKRRRSGSPGRRKEKNEEEDEETRAYRLEIEKQKAMREKLWRDKEMRRRRAAEGKQGDEKPPPPSSSSDEPPPQKLTPIIVTESKIISLKRKKQLHDAATQKNIKEQSSQHSQQQQAIQRTIPTAKILPETKRTEHSVKDVGFGTPTSSSMAVVKPVVKKTIKVQTDISKEDILDDEELLEEELLLADTPSPPPSPQSIKGAGVPLSDKSLSSNSGSGGGGPFSSTNRRVVIKSSSKDQDAAELRKGIFDRLEKKIGVNESVKRKIQRIVIKNAE